MKPEECVPGVRFTVNKNADEIYWGKSGTVLGTVSGLAGDDKLFVIQFDDPGLVPMWGGGFRAHSDSLDLEELTVDM